MSNPNICGSTSGNDNTSGSGKRVRGQRGRTKAHDIINIPDGERIQIEVNEWGQPCEGKSTAKLTTWIGTLARNHLYCPLTYPKWTNIPQSYKEDCWKEITAKFIIPEVCKTWCLDRLAKRLKDHKCDLKAEYYSKYDSSSDQRKNIDLQLTPLEQWDALLKLWDDKKHKELSDRNKKNKSKQKMRHRWVELHMPSYVKNCLTRTQRKSFQIVSKYLTSPMKGLDVLWMTSLRKSWKKCSVN
ncbi:uncharacterized protein LOC122078596 [Macadamia integrifolia]|uniref:uncharacterized protein LOC122078596 n=1 Tax=Macadamia integrifolia TaxID=60698 RepID=UPI001C4ED8F0|nr:uncharacterized protein LOC122078596 [Macadamia integrifolia]